MRDDLPFTLAFGYVGRCRTCNAALAWRLDDRRARADVARKVSYMIRADLYVEYTRRDAVDMAREMCGCTHGDTLVQEAFDAR